MFWGSEIDRRLLISYSPLSIVLRALNVHVKGSEHPHSSINTTSNNSYEYAIDSDIIRWYIMATVLIVGSCGTCCTSYISSLVPATSSSKFYNHFTPLTPIPSEYMSPK